MLDYADLEPNRGNASAVGVWAALRPQAFGDPASDGSVAITDRSLGFIPYPM